MKLEIFFSQIFLTSQSSHHVWKSFRKFRPIFNQFPVGYDLIKNFQNKINLSKLRRIIMTEIMGRLYFKIALTQTQLSWQFLSYVSVLILPNYFLEITFWNKQIYHLKGLEERNKILRSFLI